MPPTSSDRPTASIGGGCSEETRPGTRRGWNSNTTPPSTPKKRFELGGGRGELGGGRFELGLGGGGEGEEGRRHLMPKVNLHPEMKKWLS